jgi:hypothetical protein
MVNSQAKKAIDVKVQDQNNADLFFFFLTSRVSSIHFQFVNKTTTVNQTFYVEVLKRLTDAVRHKQGELRRERSLIFHHHNIPPTSFTLSVTVFSRKRHLCHGSSTILS